MIRFRSGNVITYPVQPGYVWSHAHIYRGTGRDSTSHLQFFLKIHTIYPEIKDLRIHYNVDDVGSGHINNWSSGMPIVVESTHGSSLTKHKFFALSGESTPDRLKLSPLTLPNIHGSGDICWGNNPVPPNQCEALQTFFGAPFNADLTTDELQNELYQGDEESESSYDKLTRFMALHRQGEEPEEMESEVFWPIAEMLGSRYIPSIKKMSERIGFLFDRLPDGALSLTEVSSGGSILSARIKGWPEKLTQLREPHSPSSFLLRDVGRGLHQWRFLIPYMELRGGLDMMRDEENLVELSKDVMDRLRRVGNLYELFYARDLTVTLSSMEGIGLALNPWLVKDLASETKYSRNYWHGMACGDALVPALVKTGVGRTSDSRFHDTVTAMLNQISWVHLNCCDGLGVDSPQRRRSNKLDLIISGYRRRAEWRDLLKALAARYYDEYGVRLWRAIRIYARVMRFVNSQSTLQMFVQDYIFNKVCGYMDDYHPLERQVPDDPEQIYRRYLISGWKNALTFDGMYDITPSILQGYSCSMTLPPEYHGWCSVLKSAIPLKIRRSLDLGRTGQRMRVVVKHSVDEAFEKRVCGGYFRDPEISSNPLTHAQMRQSPMGRSQISVYGCRWCGDAMKEETMSGTVLICAYKLLSPEVLQLTTKNKNGDLVTFYSDYKNFDLTPEVKPDESFDLEDDPDRLEIEKKEEEKATAELVLDSDTELLEEEEEDTL